MDYIQPLTNNFVAHEDKVRADQMKRYMKGLFPFYGIDTKTRRSLQRQFFTAYGYPLKKDLFDVVFHLWELPEREYQMCAIDLLQKFQKEFEMKDMANIEKLITTRSWWDSVDGLSVWICGAYFISYPDQIEPITGKWVRGENMWLKRSALLFQLKYKGQTDTSLLYNYIYLLKQEKDFFIRKAIGWILREYSKTDPKWVRGLLNEIQLSSLSIREASKYI